ncbi:TrkA family potassium uptake protein [Glycomyces sp. NRRL B-16210]|uniref:potassium channel family protein n=1 Tax=Glycomyces sp. NRRL B-16210 TaxID=1463821 RepID=UPI0004C0B429|nr:NAD-binding protein [Glycomyces sp. NRRL B-16210]
MHPRPQFEAAGTERRVIVVGDNGLTLRFIKNLIDRFSFRVIAVIPKGPGGQRDEIRRESQENRNLRVLEAHRVTAETVREAGLTDAYAVALMDQNDVGNLHLALKIREMSHYLGDETLPRLVIRMYNKGLRDHMQKLLGDDGVFVESDADMVARTYAAAALEQIPPGDIDIWDRRLYLTRTHDPKAQAQWVVAAGNGFGVDMIPDDDDDDEAVVRLLCLEPEQRRRWFKPVPRAAMRFARQAAHTLRRTFTKWLWIAVAFLTVIMAGGLYSLTHYKSSGDTAVSGLGDAAYVLALMAGGGFDPNTGEPWELMLTRAAVVLSGALLVPLLTGAIVQAVVERRYALAEGRMVKAVRDHVIVVGLGNMGTRVVETLRERRIPVVAIEKDRSVAGIHAARSAGAQVLLADASRPETLREAEIKYCRSLVAMAKQDSANLETALSGLECKPDLRTVMRIYNPEFASLIRRNLNMGQPALHEGAQHSSYSAPQVAAASFAGALTDDAILETIPVRGQIAYIAEAEVETGSRLDDAPAHEATVAGSHRLLAVKRASGRVSWNPDAAFRIGYGDQVLVLATRRGLDEILQRCRGVPLEP